MERYKPQRQLPAMIASIPCPLLVHSEGFIEWGNQAFSDEFGIRPTAMKHLKTRELLWCLGVQDPLAGMIAEGITFDNWEVPPLNQALSPLYLRHVRLPDEDGRVIYMLIIADRPDHLCQWHVDEKDSVG